MFSTAERLIQNTGRNKVGRFEFLKQIVTEFKESTNVEAKQQVMANLANFSYDPINYEFLRKLGVIDLFLDQLAEDDLMLAQFALGGLCNLALDNENREYINMNGGINQISICLISKNDDMVMSAITTLMFLVSPQYKQEITSDVIVRQMLELSENPNRRIGNLAKIFLADYCSKDQVSKIESLINIPLPV